MATPFLAEIKIVSFGFAPKGWALCNGQQLPINQNQALFSILGTTYGGNGQTTFGLPDLRGRAPIHLGPKGVGTTLGEAGGEEVHTIITGEMPTHNHFVNASNTQGDKNVVQGNILAQEVGKPYSAPGNLTTLNAASVSNIGGSQPHNNMQPYLVLNFCIALQGLFPSRN
jgi:microcystin-dependent protein